MSLARLWVMLIATYQDLRILEADSLRDVPTRHDALSSASKFGGSGPMSVTDRDGPALGADRYP